MTTFDEFSESIPDDLVDATPQVILANLPKILADVERIEINDVNDIPEPTNDLQIFLIDRPFDFAMMAQVSNWINTEIQVTRISDYCVLIIGAYEETDLVGLPAYLSKLAYQKLFDYDYHSHNLLDLDSKFKGKASTLEDWPDVPSNEDLLHLQSVKSGNLIMGGLRGPVMISRPEILIPNGVDFNGLDLTTPAKREQALSLLENAFMQFAADTDKFGIKDEVENLRTRRAFLKKYFSYKQTLIELPEN